MVIKTLIVNREYTPANTEQQCKGRGSTELATQDGFPIGVWVGYEWDGLCPRARLFAAAPELAEALHDVLAYYAPEALECDDWVLSGNTQTDAILRAARAALTKAGVQL